MKFVCQLEGFEDNWIEFDDYWTKREGDELFTLPEQEAFDKYIQLKATACHIEQGEGNEPITNPAKLTYDAFDDIDARIFGFVARALYQSYRELTRLGNASARLSSNTTAQMMMAALQNHKPL